MTIGILGEYLAVVLEQVRGRPIYVTSEPISSVARSTVPTGSCPCNANRLNQRHHQPPQRYRLATGASTMSNAQLLATYRDATSVPPSTSRGLRAGIRDQPCRQRSAVSRGPED